MPYPTTFYAPAQVVNEKTPSRYSCQLTLETGAKVPLASLTAVRLWVYELESGSEAAVNSITDVNILNTGRGVITETSTATTLVITFASADNAMVSASRAQERRRALIKWAWASSEAYHEFEWMVRNLSKVS